MNEFAETAVELMLQGHTENTKRRYELVWNDWKQSLNNVDPVKALPAHAVKYVSQLYKRVAPDGERLADNTIQNQFNVLHAIYSYLEASDLLKLNPFKAAARVISWRQRNQKRPTKLIDANTVIDIIESIEPTRRGIRDRAMIAILFGCGLRRSEAVRLRLSDVMVTPKGTLYLEVRKAKSGTPRKQPIPAWTFEYLSALIIDRKNQYSAPENAFIFCSGYGSEPEERHMDCKTLYRIYRRYLNAAPHSARATFATRLLEDGNSPEQVADALGHSTTTMVKVYDKRERSVDTNCGKSVTYKKGACV